MSAIMERLTIASLKCELRSAILSYRSATAHLDCGSNLAAVISPRVRRMASDANAIAARLKVLDPDFPSSWQPLPEGE